MNARLGPALIALALAGCGGGSSAVQPVTAPIVPSASAGNTASIVSTIVVPASVATSAQSGTRTPQYVSASTLGLKVTVSDIPPTGKTASFTPITTTYLLATGTNNVVVPTPASASGHTEDVTYVAYNLAPSGGAIPSNAKALAYALTAGFVVNPGQNTNNVVMSGVVDSFAAPLAESGSFGMMSAVPPAGAGAQTSLGFGAAATPGGIATLLDAGTNNISTSAGAPWPVVGAVPTLATTAATGVPVTIAETAGTCGAIGTGPHLKLAVNGGTPATSATINSTTDSLSEIYDGNGGAGWSAIITAKGQTSSLTDTLSTLAATSAGPTGNPDFSCANQTLAFGSATGVASVNEKALITIVQHTAALPYTVTVPNTPVCTGLVNVYVGSSTTQIAYGTPTSLGATGTTFTIQLQASPTVHTQCVIEIQDANAASTGGATYPGATTYVAAILPAGQSITVP